MLVVVTLELLRSRGLRLPDPVPVVLLPVIGSALLGGIRPGLVAAAVGIAYCLFVFAGQPYVNQPDNALRVLLMAASLATAAALVGRARDRLIADRNELAARRTFARHLGEYTSALVRQPVEDVYGAIAQRIPTVITCDLVALTLADPRDSRHFVRAVQGADPSLVGVEIVAGVGVAGQAILSRDVVVADRIQPTEAGAPADPNAGSAVAAAPVIADGRVLATITVGRTVDARPFTAIEREHIGLLAGATALVLGNAELRREVSESALRDPVTGLYNRTYLDAALDQLLALRRRMKPEDRKPMGVVLFDVDGFRRLNEEHGRVAGDRVLQAIGGVLRGRFRTSDTLARVGGDGFLAVLDGADRGVTVRAAGEVRALVRELALTTPRGEPLKVSVSAGGAAFHEADPGAQAVIRTVETALDSARASGKDVIVAL